MATATRTLHRAVAALKKPEVSPEQTRYILAKAAYGAARDCVTREVAALTIPRPTREEVRANVVALESTGNLPPHPWYGARGVIEDKYKLHERWREEISAADALLVWGAENAKRALGDRYAQIAVAFERGPGLTGALREKLIDICVRMEISK